MRILLANHTGAWSGAEASLMRVVAGLREEHELCVACPDEGVLPAVVDRAGVERLTLPPVDASLRLHPVQTPVGVSQLGACGLGLARASRQFAADVVHANSLRAGLVAGLARRMGGTPFVVRAHEHLPDSPVGRAVRSMLLRDAFALVAVSDFTARRLNQGLERPAAVRVYNSIDHARFDPERVAPAPLREELGLASDTPLLGQIAQITPWKDQDAAIRTLAELRTAGVYAHLALVGDVVFGGPHVRYDNHAYRRELGALADRLGLSHAVHFLGQRDDVPEIMRALDLTLLPSWEEPFGLVTVEAMALGTPPLVSSVGAGPELVEDGVSGAVLPPRSPETWAEAAHRLLDDEDALAAMGAAARSAAARFTDEIHAAQMLEIYERAARTRGTGARPAETARRWARAGKAKVSWPS
jgi:glycosyltransferase involved in cell wall biosynthesis